METRFPGESAGYRAARDRLRRITTAILLIAVESLFAYCQRISDSGH